jgi:hypothetical protein
MERTTTARIDLQKLQVLNDRLALCLDALHQVRMSAHAPAAHLGFAPAYGVNPVAQQFGYGVNPVASIYNQQFGYGISPMAINHPINNQVYNQQFGYGVSPMGYGMNPMGFSPVAGYGIPAWNTPVHSMGIPTTSWNPAFNGAYGVETRPAYTNGAFTQAYATAPTAQGW